MTGVNTHDVSRFKLTDNRARPNPMERMAVLNLSFPYELLRRQDFPEDLAGGARCTQPTYAPVQGRAAL